MRKIVVIGLGYVGLANALLLAKNNQVIGVDICEKRTQLINDRICPLKDAEMIEYLRNEKLKLSATTDLPSALIETDYVLIAIPTDLNHITKNLDTTELTELIEAVHEISPQTVIIIKSTVPIGYSKEISKKLGDAKILFSPEFLREGKALLDNLQPSRIVVGGDASEATTFANMLIEGTINSEVPIFITQTCEAEAIKLFSNSFLAARVALFNELDSFAMFRNLDANIIIKGVSADPRIGNQYNNPSFGYGGYCLPKDTKQLQASFNGIPEQMLSAAIKSNQLRAKLLVEKVLELKPERIGIHRLQMKIESDNFRESSVLSIIEQLKLKPITLVIYEPLITEPTYEGIKVEKNLQNFLSSSDVIVANRFSRELHQVRSKVFTRDAFGEH